MQFKFAGNFRSTFALVAAVGVCLSAPTSGRAEDKKPPEKVTYADHILPIFRAKCGTCHGADQAKGGLVLDNYGATMQGGASGAV
ncbi:MAG: hypothetical protein K8U57_21770, partial [Planctomycetes bacterium]|nr:hypothetical protein [Planctomycetota bacterium]